MLEPFRSITSRAAVLAFDDIDTDRIIPARFLTTTERAGLGAHLFADWREASLGTAREARILLAGRNFGCGSSREHAPWALLDFGFRVVIAPSFADIFRENALKNGLLTVAVSDAEHRAIVDAIASDPATLVSVDLSSQTIVVPSEAIFPSEARDPRPPAVVPSEARDPRVVKRSPDLRCTFPIAPFAKHCLSLGVDQLGYLLDAESEISAHELAQPAAVNTLS